VKASKADEHCEEQMLGFALSDFKLGADGEATLLQIWGPNRVSSAYFFHTRTQSSRALHSAEKLRAF